MEITAFRFDQHDRLMCITLSGAFSLPEAKLLFIETVSEIADLRPQNVLVDARELTGEPRNVTTRRVSAAGLAAWSP